MTIRRLFVALLAVALFTMAVRETLDPDMWWHLRTGEVILRDGLPVHDVFSFTVRDHTWITHEWLSQVFMWLVYRASGLTGLMLVFALITAGSFWLVYLRSDGRPYLAGFAVLLAAVASAHVWGARPQIFNILLTAAIIYLVEGCRDGRIKRQTLWLIPVLTILWANLHSGYLLGIALLAGYVLFGGTQLVLGGHDARDLDQPTVRQLALITVLSFLGAAVNPNGLELWIYPFLTLGSGAMQQYIQEWQSPDFHKHYFWPFLVLIALGVASWLRARRLSWTDALLFSGTAAAGLLSARHIPLFAVVAAPTVARYFRADLEHSGFGALMDGQTDGAGSGRLAIVNGFILLAAVVLAGLWVQVKIANNEGAIARRYPVAAVDFIERSGLDDKRVYNSYNWGGYLIWRQIPVFVDGRADVYGDDFLRYYRRTFDLTSRWSEPLEDFGVDYVLMERTNSLNTLLAASGDWQEVYRDEVASVHVRVQP